VWNKVMPVASWVQITMATEVVLSSIVLEFPESVSETLPSSSNISVAGTLLLLNTMVFASFTLELKIE
jgi:hypothetical protein